MSQMDVDAWLAEREAAKRERERIEKLIAEYQLCLPPIAAHWDMTATSLSYNDINQEILSKGMKIYSCSNEALWTGLFKPDVYEANTLWDKSLHEQRKIAGVIEAWAKKAPLSPLFLVKHGKEHLGLVADGKHRLTVARSINAPIVPFMVQAGSEYWVSLAFPSAEVVCLIPSTEG